MVIRLRESLSSKHVSLESSEKLKNCFIADEKISVVRQNGSVGIIVPITLPISVTSPSTSKSVSSQKLSSSRNSHIGKIIYSTQNYSDSASNGIAHRSSSFQGELTSQPIFSQLDSTFDRFKISPKFLGNDNSTPKTDAEVSKNFTGVCDERSSDFRFRDLDSPTSNSFREESMYPNDSEAATSALTSTNLTKSFELSMSNNDAFDKSGQNEGTNKELQKNALSEIFQNFSKSKHAQEIDHVSKGSHKSEVTNYETFKRQRSSLKLTNDRNDMISDTTYSPPSSQNLSSKIIEEDNTTSKPSILKNKFDEHSNSLDIPRPSSILKRNKSTDDSYNDYLRISDYKQGILKKHSSLDEYEVRRRSCSPDEGRDRQHDLKPILKSQRRSSLEEVHSILKHSKQQNEEALDSSSTSCPHGILKRKSSVSIGYYERRRIDSEISSDTESAVKPILKNKQCWRIKPSLESCTDMPRPILKKKQVIDAEGDEEKPMKPILKSGFKSFDEVDAGKYFGLMLIDWSTSGIKPILRKNSGYRMVDMENVKSDDEMAKNCLDHIESHSLPDCGIAMRRSFSPEQNSYSLFISDLTKLKKLAYDVDHVSQHNVEDQSKNLPLKRNAGRYKAQPITYNELVSSRSSSQNCNPTDEKSVLVVMESNEINENIKPENGRQDKNTQDVCMDEKEMIGLLKRSNSVSAKASLFTQLANKSAKVVEENSKKRLGSNINRRQLKVKCSDVSARFATQPVTWEEVAEAKKQNLEFRNKSHVIQNEILKQSECQAPLTDKEKKSKFTLKDVKIIPLLMKNRRKAKLAENSSKATYSQSEGDTSSFGGCETQCIIGNPVKGRTNENKTTEMNYGSIVAGGRDVVDECPSINCNSSIAQRLAALQKSGQLEWKKRISRIAPDEEVSRIIKINEAQEMLKKELNNEFQCKISDEVHMNRKRDGTLADRLEKLETSSQTWKKRVETSDAVQFSVVGKMASTLMSMPTQTIVSTSPISERKKKGPAPSKFRSFREQKKENQSEPASPGKSKSVTVLSRSNSLTCGSRKEESEHMSIPKINSIIRVPQIFDDDFCTFFGNLKSTIGPRANEFGQTETDFSVIKSECPRLVPVHKKIKVQRKHAASGNPLKNIANKIEIKNEYREVKTNIAEREIKRLNVEKLSKNCNLAVEALAGLASKEDFLAIELKKATPLSSPMLPYKPLMLLHVKGRRHVQTRLVEPVVDSVNSGDSFILVTPNEVYHWIGQFSNVIERSRSAEIAHHIMASHDLGYCGASQVITIAEESTKVSLQLQQFWMLLGATPEQASSIKAVPGGHPDEDEIYENSLISTNMVYEVDGDDELVPVDRYWTSIAKIQILDPNKVLVFDFGSELYVWMGKNVDIKFPRSSIRLAKELWENGFNYRECDLCPITSAKSVGVREEKKKVTREGNQRPEWCLFAKITQHMETVLFREKFLDWPDFSRVIRAKGNDSDIEKQIERNSEIDPCNIQEMLDVEMSEPDLVLENNHLGRGCQYFDDERKLFYSIIKSEVRMWHIAEFESEEVEPEFMGQFCSMDSYVIKWVYSISYTGRELSGQPSKYQTMGRDRCVYFCWQGKNASLNEQGAAALWTVELDEERGVQLRLCQGYEPPAFFNLFKGRAIIYKSSENLAGDQEWRLFICRGEVENEAVLLEVTCNIRQLRSRASFVLINVKTGITFIWHGCKVTKRVTEICQTVANHLTEKPPVTLGFSSDIILKVNEINEGNEPKEFFRGLGSTSRKLYLSLIDDRETYDTTPMLFNLTSKDGGALTATPIWSPCRHKNIITAYPFLQEDLYSANQPALFLLDSGKELWLWQGWWPERKNCNDSDSSDENNEACDNYRGSATLRWQAERKAAMRTALDYWRFKYKDHRPAKVFLVCAGLEPVTFTNLFPDWQDRDDIAEMNIMDGRKAGKVLDVEQELERLTQSTYPVEQLLQRPLPDGVDPTKLELYLSSSHFKEILNMTKEEFAALPSWKQTNLKKNFGLF